MSNRKNIQKEYEENIHDNFMDNCLSFLVDQYNINVHTVDDVQKEFMDYLNKKKRKEILSHYKIYQAKDGRYMVRLPDKDSPTGKKKLIAKKSLKELEDYIIDLHAAEEMTLRALYPQWLEHKALHVTGSTILRVKKDWNKYYENAPIVDEPISKITKLELDEWVHGLIRTHNMGKHKYGNFSLIIRQMLDYAVDLELIEKNRFLDVRIDKRRVLTPEKKKPAETQTFTEEERIALIKHAWTKFQKRSCRVQLFVPLGVILALTEGLRVGEIAALKYEDVNGSTLHVGRMVNPDTGEITEHTKSAIEDRYIPLLPEAARAIEASLQLRQELGMDTDGYILAINNEPKKTYKQLQKLFSQYCIEIGIPVRSIHKARKTVCTALEPYLSPATICAIVGNTETVLSNSYVYANKNQLESFEKMAAALPSSDQQQSGKRSQKRSK